MKSLVVEDNFFNRKLIQEFLFPQGACDVAANGEEALEIIKYRDGSIGHFL